MFFRRFQAFFLSFSTTTRDFMKEKLSVRVNFRWKPVYVYVCSMYYLFYLFIFYIERKEEEKEEHTTHSRFSKFHWKTTLTDKPFWFCLIIPLRHATSNLKSSIKAKNINISTPSISTSLGKFPMETRCRSK